MNDALAFLSADALAALDAHVLAVVRAEIARPEYVSQKTVQAITGLPARDYMTAAREGAFPSSKLHRLVMATTADVLAFIAAHRRAPAVANCNDVDEEEAELLASVGARRISR